MCMDAASPSATGPPDVPHALRCAMWVPPRASLWVMWVPPRASLWVPPTIVGDWCASSTHSQRAVPRASLGLSESRIEARASRRGHRGEGIEAVVHKPTEGGEGREARGGKRGEGSEGREAPSSCSLLVQPPRAASSCSLLVQPPPPPAARRRSQAAPPFARPPRSVLRARPSTRDQPA